jgi:predicted nucleotidyltransferase component of viral defense system
MLYIKMRDNMTLDIATHKNILIKILKDVYTNHLIAQSLGFKGGTAALLFYGLNRFSVDLDFDLLDESKTDEIYEHILIILKSYGTVKESRKKRYSLFFLLSYDSKVVGAYNVKIEINKRTFGSHYETKQYLGIPMQVMVQKDMAANKLVAMYERIGKTNRDIFDVWFFLHNGWPINKDIVERRTHMKYVHFLQKCVDSLEAISNHNILSGIGELLTDTQKVWAKSKLKVDTIFLLKLAIDHEH